MEREIFIDGVSYQIPTAVYRFVNDCLASSDGNSASRGSDVFGYDDNGQPYRTLPLSDDNRLDQIENLLQQFGGRFEALLRTISGGGGVKPAGGPKKALTVVDRVGTRPLYREILDRISPSTTPKEIKRILMENDYAESSARNIAPTYLRYVSEKQGKNSTARNKVKFSQLTEIGREGAVKLYQEVLDAIAQAGGISVSRSEVVTILTDFGFSESSAQVRARYYMHRLEQQKPKVKPKAQRTNSNGKSKRCSGTKANGQRCQFPGTDTYYRKWFCGFHRPKRTR